MQLHRLVPFLALATLALPASPARSATRADDLSAPSGKIVVVPEASSELRWLDTELFSLQIPTSWQEVSDTELGAVREQAERIAREVFPPDITADSPLDRVLWLNAFESEDQSTRLFLLISEIPPPEGAGRPYVERKVLGYADWQRAQAVVDKVRVGDAKELNGMPAVEVVFDLPEGATLYTVHLWTSVYRDRVGTVVAVANAGTLARVRAAIARAVASVKPSRAVVEAQQEGSLRAWVRTHFWAFEDDSAVSALVKRVMIVLVTFVLCFALSLRLLYQAILVWYRWRKMEDRVLDMARRAAQDALRLGYFYSQRLTLSCALLSMTVTTAALVWLAPP